jgi:hypothetical protein
LALKEPEQTEMDNPAGAIADRAERIMTTTPMTPPRIVRRKDWFAARKGHLAKQKAMTSGPGLDALGAASAAMGQDRIAVCIRGADGKGTFADLFQCSHLDIDHLNLTLGSDNGCCLYQNTSAQRLRVEQLDLSFEPIKFVKWRTGWTFEWVSSHSASFSQNRTAPEGACARSTTAGPELRPARNRANIFLFPAEPQDPCGMPAAVASRDQLHR